MSEYTPNPWKDILVAPRWIILDDGDAKAPAWLIKFSRPLTQLDNESQRCFMNAVQFVRQTARRTGCDAILWASTNALEVYRIIANPNAPPLSLSTYEIVFDLMVDDKTPVHIPLETRTTNIFHDGGTK